MKHYQYPIFSFSINQINGGVLTIYPYYQLCCLRANDGTTPSIINYQKKNPIFPPTPIDGSTNSTLGTFTPSPGAPTAPRGSSSPCCPRGSCIPGRATWSNTPKIEAEDLKLGRSTHRSVVYGEWLVVLWYFTMVCSGVNDV